MWIQTQSQKPSTGLISTMNSWFKKETPKEAAQKAKRETRREVRVRTHDLICCVVFCVCAAKAGSYPVSCWSACCSGGSTIWTLWDVSHRARAGVLSILLPYLITGTVPRVDQTVHWKKGPHLGCNQTNKQSRLILERQKHDSRMWDAYSWFSIHRNNPRDRLPCTFLGIPHLDHFLIVLGNL